jgi:hypothetical protein
VALASLRPRSRRCSRQSPPWSAAVGCGYRDRGNCAGPGRPGCRLDPVVVCRSSSCLRAGPLRPHHRGWLLDLRFEDGFGGADALKPRCFVGDPVGLSSPRRSLPWARSSSASAASAWLNQAETSAARRFSVSRMRPYDSPCGRWHSPQSCCRPAPHARASQAPAPGTA